jgi:hypothetical protein
MKTLGTTGSGARQSSTYFDPAKRRAMLFNAKKYDTPQYTAAGPIAVDTSSNINEGAQVFGRAGSSEPVSLAKLMEKRQNLRWGLLGDDAAVANEKARRELWKSTNVAQYKRHKDLASGQRVADERDIAAAADRDKYGISDTALLRTNRLQSTGINPYSRMTDLTRVGKIDAQAYPYAAARIEDTAGLNAPGGDPWHTYSDAERAKFSEKGAGGAPNTFISPGAAPYGQGEYFLKKQKLQAQQDRVRLGSYVYNDTLRELWEGTAPMPIQGQRGRTEYNPAEEGPGQKGVGFQVGRYPTFESGYDQGEGWVPGPNTFSGANPFEDPYRRRYVAPGEGFNTEYKTASMIGRASDGVSTYERYA